MARRMRALRGDLQAGAHAVRQAAAAPGRERDLAAQAVKAALAAWVAWAVAGWWLKAPVAFVAPWVAVVLVESTVYRSIAHGLQQLAAIATGTVIATAVALALDDTMVAMALVLPTAVLLGNWQRLGSQGIYAATGALFVLTSSPVTVATSAARMAEALFGAAVGIAVNALIRPPVYLRDSRAALRDAADEAHHILRDVARALAGSRWDTEEAAARHERALRLQRLVDQARAALVWSRESLRINLRRRPRVTAPGKEYDDAIVVLDHAAVHTAEVTRTVLKVAGDESPQARPHPQLAERYAEFLRRTAEAVRLYGLMRFGHRCERDFQDAVRELRETLDGLRHRLHGSAPEDPDLLATYGTLLAQAHRLSDQLAAAAAP
ncbi:aromatic acid exporter family protein [Streptomyces glomeratus]|nr:aromatic acid exporter family protein [Streptomyces glomeratus]MCF1510767.1 aromatic acid exporter family protein [Streptomyces glomeratus]